MRFFLFILLFPLTNSFANSAKIAIVIDDVGYRYSDAKVLDIPGKISYSVLPHTPYGKKLAIRAQQKNRDVFLHIPMESEQGKKLGPAALTTAMNEQEIKATLTLALTEIPFALGINNHMGSKLTKQYQPMLWTMSFLKEHGLLFLDSRTSAASQAKQAAIDMRVPVQSRHIFLDNKLDEEYISKQFAKLIKKAHKNDIAIAIAHPHPETVNVLKRLIPTLKHHDIELVSITSLYPEFVTKKKKAGYTLTAKSELKLTK